MQTLELIGTLPKVINKNLIDGLRPLSLSGSYHRANQKVKQPKSVRDLLIDGNQQQSSRVHDQSTSTGYHTHDLRKHTRSNNNSTPTIETDNSCSRKLANKISECLKSIGRFASNNRQSSRLSCSQKQVFQKARQPSAIATNPTSPIRNDRSRPDRNGTTDTDRGTVFWNRQA